MAKVFDEKLAKYMKDYLDAEPNDYKSLIRFKDTYLESEKEYLKKLQADKDFNKTIASLRRAYSAPMLYKMAFDCMEKIESNKLDYKGLIYEETCMIYYLYAVDDYQKVNELILLPDDDKKPAKKQKALVYEMER